MSTRSLSTLRSASFNVIVTVSAILYVFESNDTSVSWDIYLCRYLSCHTILTEVKEGCLWSSCLSLEHVLNSYKLYVVIDCSQCRVSVWIEDVELVEHNKLVSAREYTSVVTGFFKLESVDTVVYSLVVCKTITLVTNREEVCYCWNALGNCSCCSLCCKWQGCTGSSELEHQTNGCIGWDAKDPT